MSCRKEWNLDILNTLLPKSFITDEYRKNRELILFEEEKTYLPPLQEEAERLLGINRLERKILDLEHKKRENFAKEDQLVSTQRLIDRQLQQDITTVYNQRGTLLHKSIKSNAREKKEFIMKCPMENCRGFLSSKYKCGLCESTICKDCHRNVEEKQEKKEENKQENQEENPEAKQEEKQQEEKQQEEKQQEEKQEEKKEHVHVCNPDDVATITELQRTTKPCPKCHCRIYKTDGCDQMFCIQCHTAFSWRTGEIESGIIHNPHYFDALRRGNIVDIRHRTMQGGCGPMPGFYIIRTFMRTLKQDIQLQITHLYQNLTHHRQVTMPQIAQRENRDKDRISYLMGNLDEKKFKQRLYVYQQTTLRKREEHQIMDSYVTIGEELFRSFTHENALEILQQLKMLQQVTHEAICHIDKKYTHKGAVAPHSILTA
jgi:hypothetical protein